MAAPSKAWVVIADSQIDADSPLDTTLVTALRDDVVHLEEWLGDGYTAAKDHDHDAVNSKSVVLGDGVVTTAKLAATSVTGAKISKTVVSSSSQAILAGATWTPAAGVYQVVSEGSDDSTGISFQILVSAVWRNGTDASVNPRQGVRGGIFICDGTNMRFINNSTTTETVYYQTF